MSYIISPVVNSNIDFNLGSWSGYNYFPVDASSGNINIVLQDMCWPSLSYMFNRVDTTANTVTFLPGTGHTIEGVSSLTLAGRHLGEVIFDGAGNWLMPRFSYV
jgi:hypothetical protein